MIEFISNPKEHEWEKAATATGGAYEHSYAYSKASLLAGYSQSFKLLALKDGEPVESRRSPRHPKCLALEGLPSVSPAAPRRRETGRDPTDPPRLHHHDAF